MRTSPFWEDCSSFARLNEVNYQFCKSLKLTQIEKWVGDAKRCRNPRCASLEVSIYWSVAKDGRDLLNKNFRLKPLAHRRGSPEAESLFLFTTFRAESDFQMLKERDDFADEKQCFHSISREWILTSTRALHTALYIEQRSNWLTNETKSP